MSAAANLLTPSQLAVLEVYRRLQQVSLPDPTIDTLVQLSKLKAPTVRLALDALVTAGLLERTGKRAGGFRLKDAEVGSVTSANLTAAREP